MEIPPRGWGAVEILIWDYYQTLINLGHDVKIVNTRNLQEILNVCSQFKPDFTHIQYDEFWQIADYLDCSNVAITSHFGYLDQPTHPAANHYFNMIFRGFLTMKKTKIFALSESIKNMYLKYGFDSSKIFVVPNGVREDLFEFKNLCEYPDKSIYLAKIDHRKRQFLFESINSLYYAGNIADYRYKKTNYLGEWDKPTLYKNLTKYANLVLLSDGEAHPLVCLEAMSAGLGLVISEWATANLDTNLPFISVIPENKINDIGYVSNVINENRLLSISMREQIRNYAVNNFSWTKIVKDYYIPSITK